jgi:hypothetical protein
MSEILTHGVLGLAWICIKISLKIVKNCNFYSYFNLRDCFQKMEFFSILLEFKQFKAEFY